jgi:L-arabinose transport system permease protein
MPPGRSLLGLLAAMVCGGFVGLVNGVVIARFRINALITTLATMQIVRGLALIASDGRAVGINDPGFYQLALSKFLGVPTPIWVMASSSSFSASCSTAPSSARTRWRSAAIRKHRDWPASMSQHAHLDLCAAGLVCGIAGILLASRITSGQPNAATGLELSVISACVLGGVRLLAVALPWPASLSAC